MPLVPQTPAPKQAKLITGPPIGLVEAHVDKFVLRKRYLVAVLEKQQQLLTAGGDASGAAVAKALGCQARWVTNVLRQVHGSWENEQSELALLETEHNKKMLEKAAKAARRTAKLAAQAEMEKAAEEAAAVAQAHARRENAGAALPTVEVTIDAVALPEVLPLPQGCERLPTASEKPVSREARRVNFMCGPLGRDEQEGDREEIMPRARKLELCHSAVDVLFAAQRAGIEAWYAGGRLVSQPPPITTQTGGTEIGEKFGKLHIQFCAETLAPVKEKWEVTRKRLKEYVVSHLTPLLDVGKGEVWQAIKMKRIPQVKDKAKGGLLYQLMYAGHKEHGDHAYARKMGVDAAGATALGVYHLDTIWTQAVEVYTKFASNSKGKAGQKEWKQLAAIVSGRTANAVQIIDKTSAPGLMLKFTANHDLVAYDLDPISIQTLMLAEGTYGLGPTYIATSHGGVLSALRLAAFMRLMSNGLLAACRFLLCQIEFGTDTDDEATRLFAMNRSPLLPPLSVLSRMTLLELKQLKKNNMAIPRRLSFLTEHSLRPDAPSALVLDLSAALEPRLLELGASSCSAAAMLQAHQANVNPLLLNAFAAGGDDEGLYAASYLHAILKTAEARGLLAFAEPDCYHLFTDGTKQLAQMYLAAADPQPATPQDRIRYLFDALVARAPISVEYELAFVTSLNELTDLAAQYCPAESASVRPNVIYLFVVAVEYNAPVAATRTAPQEASVVDPGSAPAPAPAPARERARAQPTVAAHHYVAAFWPGHAQHIFTGEAGGFGTISEAALWPAVREAPSVDAAAKLLLKHAPEVFFRHGTELLKNKALQLQMLRARSTEVHRKLSEFNIPPLRLLSTHSVLLCGDAGIGKTCYAEAHGKRPFILKTLDQLKAVPGDCDLLIFDDMRFDSEGLDLTAEEMICLLDVKRASAIKCRHYDGDIPCLPRIFTTNLDANLGETIFPPGKSRQQRRAINRRTDIRPFLTKPLFDGAMPDADSD